MANTTQNGDSGMAKEFHPATAASKNRPFNLRAGNRQGPPCRTQPQCIEPIVLICDNCDNMCIIYI